MVAKPDGANANVQQSTRSNLSQADIVTTSAAIVLCALLCCLGVFQLLLAGGAPLGRLAWGGQHRVLPLQLRLGSVVSVALYVLFAVAVLDRANLVSVLPENMSQVGIWVVAGFLLLGAFPNLISRSAPERYVMAPLALLLSCLSVVVGLGR